MMGGLPPPLDVRDVPDVPDVPEFREILKIRDGRAVSDVPGGLALPGFGDVRDVREVRRAQNFQNVRATW